MDEQEEEMGEVKEEEEEKKEQEVCRSPGTIAVDICAKHTCWGTFACIHAAGGK